MYLKIDMIYDAWLKVSFVSLRTFLLNLFSSLKIKIKVFFCFGKCWFYFLVGVFDMHLKLIKNLPFSYCFEQIIFRLLLISYFGLIIVTEDHWFYVWNKIWLIVLVITNDSKTLKHCIECRFYLKLNQD